MNLKEGLQLAVACDTQTLVINASAGSGKTSGLVSYAEVLPHARIFTWRSTTQWQQKHGASASNTR